MKSSPARHFTFSFRQQLLRNPFDVSTATQRSTFHVRRALLVLFAARFAQLKLKLFPLIASFLCFVVLAGDVTMRSEKCARIQVARRNKNKSKTRNEVNFHVSLCCAKFCLLSQISVPTRRANSKFLRNSSTLANQIKRQSTGKALGNLKAKPQGLT